MGQEISELFKHLRTCEHAFDFTRTYTCQSCKTARVNCFSSSLLPHNRISFSNFQTFYHMQYFVGESKWRCEKGSTNSV